MLGFSFLVISHILPIDLGQFIRSVGWQRLLDVSEDLDAVRVGQRCVRLMTLQLPPPESALALVGRQEELEAEMFFFERDGCHLIPCEFVWNSCFLWAFPAGGLAHDFGEETV